MFASAFTPQLSLRESSRVPSLSRQTGISAAELACLLACGALATLAIGLFHPSRGVPGHAILRGVLPISLGLALVPRRWAGTVMAIGAGITALAMTAVHVGRFPAPAMLSVLALGPVLDVALLGQPTGWRLYARFIIAGAVANLLAFAFKVAGVQLGMEIFSGGGREFMRLALHTVIASYIVCGALAGFLGAVACFAREAAMIYVGIDDTDTLDDPGTNQLARHLVRELAGQFRGRMVLRHQLLEDPRVPCTKKNGCASILFEPVGWAPPTTSNDANDRRWAVPTLLDRLRELIIPWCPRGSDPGLCVTDDVPQAVVDWGMRCQRELVTQSEAREIAAANGLHLEGLGGTEDGVIGALAAVGLMATRNDGRVVHFGSGCEDWYDVTGCLDVRDILQRGVDEIRQIDTDRVLTAGTIDVGKRLRPNYHQGKIVLYVTGNQAPHWEAVRVT